METLSSSKVLLDDTVPLTAVIEASQNVQSHTVSILWKETLAVGVLLHLKRMCVLMEVITHLHFSQPQKNFAMSFLFYTISLSFNDHLHCDAERNFLAVLIKLSTVLLKVLYKAYLG